MIPHRNISNQISTIDITKRISNLYEEINKTKYDSDAQNTLLKEFILCSELLDERYIKSMNMVDNNSNICVFISHSSIDIALARTLATDLMNAGYSVFLDDWSIDIGDRLHSKLNEGIDRCIACIMLISDSYIKSMYCNDEWSAFYKKASKKNDCMLYPIIIDESEPPNLISTIKYVRINTQNDYDSCLNQLLKALKKHYPEK